MDPLKHQTESGCVVVRDKRAKKDDHDCKQNKKYENQVSVWKFWKSVFSKDHLLSCTC